HMCLNRISAPRGALSTAGTLRIAKRTPELFALLISAIHGRVQATKTSYGKQGQSHSLRSKVAGSRFRDSAGLPGERRGTSDQVPVSTRACAFGCCTRCTCAVLLRRSAKISIASALICVLREDIVSPMLLRARRRHLPRRWNRVCCVLRRRFILN